MCWLQVVRFLKGDRESLEINTMRFSYFLAWMLAMLGIGHFSYMSFNWLIVSLITSLVRIL